MNPISPAFASSPDHELLHRIAGGDRSALEQLYRANAGWLAARLRLRCRDDDLVDMAVQDTFLAVWRNAASYRGTGDVGAWLWGIALRRLIDQTRKRRPEPVDPAALGAHPGAADPSAEAEVLAARLGGDFGEAFRTLDPDLQAVLLVTAVDGLTTKEASVVLGIPQGTVKTRLARARSQMQGRYP
jgi:RNA polymerase sigma-70 factor, ECF subfamily